MLLEQTYYLTRCPKHKGRKTGSFKASVAAVYLSGVRLESERIWKNGRRYDGLNREVNSGLVQLLPGRLCTLDEEKPSDRGGPGHVVQIDETCVRKAKYNRGRRIPPRWVFGGLDTTTRKGFLVKAPNRTAKTLLTIVMQRIRPGTEVHSDE